MVLNKKRGLGQSLYFSRNVQKKVWSSCENHSCFFRGAQKRGMTWGLIISMITGILVVTIGYFIFSESFTKDDIDWEGCRQSLIARNALPEKDLAITIASTKGVLPLKCGTKVVNIDYKDLEKAEKEIAEVISSCWYMVGRGDYKIFPGRTALINAETPCMVCARIHIDSDFREFYSDNIMGDGRIDIEYSLDRQLENYGVSYWEYLNPERGSRAFMYFKGWDNEGFNTTYVKDLSSFEEVSDDIEAFSFPKYLDPEKGDLFVVYAEPTTVASFSKNRGVKPYMVLLQYDDFDKLSELWIKYDLSLKSKVCSSIESVPS